MMPLPILEATVRFVQLCCGCCMPATQPRERKNSPCSLLATSVSATLPAVRLLLLAVAAENKIRLPALPITTSAHISQATFPPCTRQVAHRLIRHPMSLRNLHTNGKYGQISPCLQYNNTAKAKNEVAKSIRINAAGCLLILNRR